MSDRFAAHRPPTITKLSNRTRRLTRSYVLQRKRMPAMTWANATRGKSVFWLHAAVRRGHLAVR
jgi:hypothetical protein